MSTRDDITKEALTWSGTPYHDHAARKYVGVDCAYLPLRIFQTVGLIPVGVEPPYYSPHQWLHKGEDTTYLDMVLKYAKREITEAEVRPGDLILYKILKSWTHGAVVIRWPSFVLHPVKGKGVLGAGADEGFLHRRQRRFFDFVGDAI